MFIFDSVWERVRDRFDDTEKAALQAAILGRVICPEGVSIDVDRLDEALAQKLIDTLTEHNRAEAQRAGK